MRNTILTVDLFEIVLIIIIIVTMIMLNTQLLSSTFANIERVITMLQIVESTTVDETRTSISNDEVDANYVSINDATKLLTFKHAQYTRRLVLEGKLNAIKVQYAHYAKWEILVESINVYNSRTRRSSSGKRRYILRTSVENEKKIREALTALEIPFELELSYQKKSK